MPGRNSFFSAIFHGYSVTTLIISPILEIECPHSTAILTTRLWTLRISPFSLTPPYRSKNSKETTWFRRNSLISRQSLLMGKQFNPRPIPSSPSAVPCHPSLFSPTSIALLYRPPRLTLEELMV